MSTAKRQNITLKFLYPKVRPPKGREFGWADFNAFQASRSRGCRGCHGPPEFGKPVNLGPDPIWTTCPNCNEEILTMTPKKRQYFSNPGCWGTLLRLHLLLHSFLHGRLEKCVAYLPQLQLRHRKKRRKNFYHEKKPRYSSIVYSIKPKCACEITKTCEITAR